MTELSELLPQVIDATTQASDLVLQYWQKDISVRSKPDNSPVTEADLKSNELLTQKLGELLPGVPVIAEETSLPKYAERKNWKTFWLVDPLDGTRSFVSGSDEFSINVGLIKDGTPILGALEIPAKNLTYFGAKGVGAFKVENGKRTQIFSRKTKTPTIVVSRSDLGYVRSKLPTNFSGQVRAVSSALKFGYLAEGTADVYFRRAPSMEWDVAAGDAIYRYSGEDRENPVGFKYNKEKMENGPFIVGDAALVKDLTLT